VTVPVAALGETVAVSVTLAPVVVLVLDAESEVVVEVVDVEEVELNEPPPHPVASTDQKEKRRAIAPRSILDLIRMPRLSERC
jgi:hypothetical protein